MLTHEESLALFERYRPLAAGLAGVALRKLPRNIERLELETIALSGLWSASRRTDTDGYGFSSFARQRINGAIQDFLRSSDHATRYSRAQNRKTGSPVVVVESIDPELMDRFAAPELEPVVDTSALAGAIATLPARTREIIQRYDFGGEQMRAIGRTLNLSEPRVSQIRKMALIQLRESGLLDRSVLEI